MNDVNIVMFLSVARAGSFTAAANEMRTTKQFVSKSIQALEEELGLTLFLRDSHTVALTEAGEIMQDYYTRNTNLLQNPLIYNTLSDRRVLSIGIDDWMGQPPGLSGALSRFEQEHNCGLRIIQMGDGKVLGMLQSGEVDAVIASHYLVRRIEALCDICPLTEQELQLQVSTSLPYPSAEHWAVLRSIPFLTSFSGENSLTEVYDRVRRQCQQVGYTPETISVLPNYTSVITEAFLGNGVTITPHRPPVSQMIQIPLRRHVTVVFARLRENRDPHTEQLLRTLQREWGGDKA